MLTKKIYELMEKITKTIEAQSESEKLPDNTYYLDDRYILCCPRTYGVSRFPYSCDGYTLWAYSNGYIYANEGVFNAFRQAHDEADPSVGIFAGIRREDGLFFPVSILGGAEQLFEPFDVKRYLVYSLAAAYYIADTDFATFAVRTDMSERKEMRFSFVCINKTEKPINMCITSCVDVFMQNDGWDNMWTRTERISHYLGDGRFLLERRGEYHAMSIARSVLGAEVEKSYHTTAKREFVGNAGGRVFNALCLKTGKLEVQTDYIGKETTPIAAEILHVTVKDTVRVDYVMSVAHSPQKLERFFEREIDARAIDLEVEKLQQVEEKRLSILNVRFLDWCGRQMNAEVFNRFFKNVQKQVDFCAMGKNYVEDMIGIRDVFQQLEQALLWDGTQAREKILRTLNYIDPSGRSPRQFTIPKYEGEIPRMDLREFIDQGNWIISCLYSYLAWTGDDGILKEECGYLEIVDDKTVKKSEIRDSVLDHLIRITDYLMQNIDWEDGTNCLRILFGDWNDALDGLGRTNDSGKMYGTGVSVMASLHFYQNIQEIVEILQKVGGYEKKIEEYLVVKMRLKEGLLTHAVVTNEEGEKRLIHGWGDHNRYKVGSFCDSDGKSRISFAPNAFWAITGMVRETPELKTVIVESLHALDSEFGLRTLTPAFEPDAPGIGRLASILPGTAENDCVYCHASMFSIMALFILGDSEYAWKQFEKVLPITHEYVTRSPFVMSNSYLENEEQGLHGESAIDWYTGGGTVLIKNVVRYGLGILPDLGGLTIQTAAKLPCKEVNADILVKGCHIHYIYVNRNLGKRCIYMNGEVLKTTYDSLMQTEKAYLTVGEMTEYMEILVCD